MKIANLPTVGDKKKIDGKGSVVIRINRVTCLFFFAGRSRYLEFNSLGSSCVYCVQCIYVDIVVLCQYEGTWIHSLQQSRI